MPCFVNSKKGTLYSQPQVKTLTSCLPMVGGALWLIRLLPPPKLVVMILLKHSVHGETSEIWFDLIWLIVLNPTFINVSAISWRPVLVVAEAGLTREHHQPILAHISNVFHLLYN
jgi:hypothetical protein